MSCARPFLALLLALSLAACGKDAPSTGRSGSSSTGLSSASVPADLGQLVPSDVVALLYVRSPEALEKKVREFAARIDPELAAEVKLGDMARSLLPGASQFWDGTKPVAVCISRPEKGQEFEAEMQGGRLVTFVMGVTDAKAALAGLQAEIAKRPEGRRPSVRAAGSFVALTGAPSPKWTGTAPALIAAAPDADVALRVDLGALVGLFRTEIDEGLAGLDEGISRGMGGAPPQQAQQLQGMLGGLLEGARDLVDSAESCELALDLDGKMLDLRVGFAARTGSKLDRAHDYHGELAALAQHLPEGFPAHALLRMEYGKLMTWLEPMMEGMFEALPAESREQMKASWTESMEMSKLLGPNFAVALDITQEGIQLVEVLDVKDGAAYLQRLEQLAAVGEMMPGLRIAKGEPTKVSGVDISTWSLEMDFAKLAQSQGGADVPEEAQEMITKMQGVLERVVGKDGFRMHLAHVADKLVMTMGRPTHMASVIESLRTGKGKAPAALEAALRKAGGKPSFLLHMDVRALASHVLALARDVAPDQELPAIPAGAPIPVAAWGSHDGRHYGAGLSLDAASLIELVKSLMDGG